MNFDLFFVGIEFGIYFMIDGGEKWIELIGGMLMIVIWDIEI